MREFIISEKALDETIGFTSSKCVGTVLKRIDLLNNVDNLKKMIKESIYENFRDIKYLIKAHSDGAKETYFFKKAD